MSTIFSPSAGSWKPPDPLGKCFSHWKGEKLRERRWAAHIKRRLQSKRGISRRRCSVFVWHTSICSCCSFKDVSRLQYLEFSERSRRSAWFAWPALQEDAGTPPAGPHAFFWEVWSLGGTWLGAIHPICTDNETAWQGHYSNYFARLNTSQSN